MKRLCAGEESDVRDNSAVHAATHTFRFKQATENNQSESLKRK